MFEIVTLPSKNLRKRSEDIDPDILSLDETKQYIEELIETMYASDGIGIASPQVGKNIRICIIGKAAIQKNHQLFGKDLVLVNPNFQKTSKKTGIETEGCLSVPGIFGNVKRNKDILVSAIDRDGKPLEFNAKGFFARVVQHEIDHLDGILFIDKATNIQKADQLESELRETKLAI